MKPLFCLVAVFASMAQATLIFDNTAALTSGSDPVAPPSTGYFGPLYDSFTTGAGGGVLADLKVLLSGSATSSGSFDIALYGRLVNQPRYEARGFRHPI